jgi:hypothetical protein
MATATLVNSVASLDLASAVTSSNNGTILYATFQNNLSLDLYTSTDGGVSWGPLLGTSPGGFNQNYTGITSDSTGTNLYLAWAGSGLYNSTNSGSTWTAITGNLDVGGSETCSNIQSIACDSTATKLLVVTNLNNLYVSLDSGVTSPWISSGSLANSNCVACSSDFSIRYAVTSAGDIITSTGTNYSTWTNIPGNINDNWTSLTCSSDGTKVFAVNAATDLYYFSGGNNTLVSTIFGSISSYSNGSGILSSSPVPEFNTYNMTYGGGSVACFLQGTQILCKIDGIDKYISVEDMKKGTLVKTSLNGYKKVELIGKQIIQNPGNNERIKDRLYKCSPQKYPELKNDLYITGCHSILVNKITDKEREEIKKRIDRIFITDKKYRLIACVDERAEPWTSSGKYTVWHFALENNDIKMNYGVYANGGLLVETCSINIMKNYSNMQLI